MSNTRWSSCWTRSRAERSATRRCSTTGRSTAAIKRATTTTTTSSYCPRLPSQPRRRRCRLQLQRASGDTVGIPHRQLCRRCCTARALTRARQRQLRSVQYRRHCLLCLSLPHSRPGCSRVHRRRRCLRLCLLLCVGLSTALAASSVRSRRCCRRSPEQTSLRRRWKPQPRRCSLPLTSHRSSRRIRSLQLPAQRPKQ